MTPCREARGHSDEDKQHNSSLILSLYYRPQPTKCQHQMSLLLYFHSSKSKTNFISQLFGGTVK